MLHSKAELIVHPVRLRIIEVVQGQELSSQQIAEQLPDVPQATLYRQIKALHAGGLLQVVAERLVHGIVERVYTMPLGAAHFSREEFAQIGAEDHARYFAIFLGVLNGAMSRYVRQESYDVVREGMTYFQAALHLTDEEGRRLRVELLDLVNRYGEQRPGQGRRRRTLGIALIPERSEELENRDAESDETLE